MRSYFFVGLLLMLINPIGMEKSSIALEAGQEGLRPSRKISEKTIRLERKDLNQPVSQHRLYVDIITVGGPGERTVICTVMRGKPVPQVREPWDNLLDDQLIPYSHQWLVRPGNGQPQRRWLAGFMKNKDNTYHTIVNLPPDDLARSELILHFQDVDKDGIREDISLAVNMSEYDWSDTASDKRQSVQ